ncbi:MAG: glycoside hydrolase family 127 protein [Clostridia bacterium]|nr:glycoside hydrolase family 127 protein [Clostridia bacterium]
MIPYQTDNIRHAPRLEDIQLGGAIGEQMDTFFRQRVTGTYARDVIYRETEDQFRIQDDDKTPVGMWRGEFWGKWVISACRVARYQRNNELKAFLHEAALRLLSLARPDGYIGTYRDPENFYPCDVRTGRATVGWDCNWNWNLWCRKYTLWGLLECYLLTEDPAILEGAVRFSDQLIDMLHRKGAAPGDTGTFNGLPTGSIMKPMLILYRLTENRRYLDFALEIAAGWERADGRVPNLIANGLAGKPVHEWYQLPEKWAKAYEMMSCLDGLLELYRVTGTEKYLLACRNIHAQLAEHELNPLFSVGFNDQFAHGAAWINAISEPCDVIHWMRLCYELYCLTGAPGYIDPIERAFYNPFLAGAFADGNWGARGVRCLGRHMVAVGQASMRYSHCCVNNMPRGFLNACETFVMTDGEGIWVNLYSPFTAVLRLKSGEASVQIGGTWLRDGRVSVTLTVPAETEIHLRIPGWSRHTWIDGTRYDAPGTYAEIRIPAGSSRVELAFDMTPEIREFPGNVETYPAGDFRVRRFVEQNPVSADDMIRERRCVVLYGPLLLTRSKLAGNTEEEMFGSDTICGRGYRCMAEPADSDAVRNRFIVTFTNGSHTFTTPMCDYATGSNRWSEEDPRLFNIYL